MRSVPMVPAFFSRCRTVGGGFRHCKTHPYPNRFLVLVAAKRLGRTVRWNQWRTEAFSATALDGIIFQDSVKLALDIGRQSFLGRAVE